MAVKDIEATVDLRRLNEAIKKNPRKLESELRKTVTKHLLTYVRREVAGKMVRYRSQNNSDRIQRRSTNLSRAIGAHVVGHNLETLAWLSGVFGVKYAQMQEYGGTVVPKTSKYLAVPLPAALTPAGLPRGRPREFPNTFFLNRPGKRPVIMQKISENEVTPLFVLMDKVRIKGRLGFVKAFDKGLPALVDVFRAAINVALQEVGS